MKEYALLNYSTHWVMSNYENVLAEDATTYILLALMTVNRIY